MLEQRQLNKLIEHNMLQPLALGSFSNWVKLLKENHGVDPKYLGRALYVSTVSFLTGPVRLYQRLRYRETFENVNIKRQPIFILGHWRSGTTHLHNLMCHDPRLGYISSLQVIAPDIFYVAGDAFKSILRAGTPETRLIDNMTWSIDSPQEEEMALGNMSPYSLYHLWSFPQNARHYFERYALFKDIPSEIVGEWKRKYLDVIKMATLNMRGRRLVIKNPPNTGRVKVLLEMFPEAKFVHIHRDPYRVFASTRHLYRKTLQYSQLQDVSEEQIEQNVLYFYTEMMQRYLQERDLIPTGNLIEIGYDALDQRPLETLHQIYLGLELKGFKRKVLGPASRYLDSLNGYRKNSYQISSPDIEKVNQHWRFAFEEWGYPMLAP